MSYWLKGTWNIEYVFFGHEEARGLSMKTQGLDHDFIIKTGLFAANIGNFLLIQCT